MLLPTGCILVLEPPRKTQHNQTLDETLHSTQERDRTKSIPVVLVFHIQQIFPAAGTQQLSYTHSSCAAVEGPVSLPYEFGNIKCWVSQNKGVYIELETGKIFPSKVISPKQAVWNLFLIVRKYSKPKAPLIIWLIWFSCYAFPNKALTSNVTIFRDKAFREVSKVKWDHEVGP